MEPPYTRHPAQRGGLISGDEVLLMLILLAVIWDISKYNLISGDWNRGVPLYTEVSSVQWVRIEEFLLYTEVSSVQWVRI